MAQRLLVERNDKKLLQPLMDLALKGTSTNGRFHALWTMEGLHMIQPDLLFQLLSDQDQLIRATAIRLLEPMAKMDKDVRIKLEKEIVKSWKKASAKEILQIALTAGVLDIKTSQQLLTGIAEQYDSSALIRDAILSSLQGQEFAFLRNLMKSPFRETHTPGKEIFLEMLTTSIVRKRDPAELESLLSILSADNDSILDWQEKTIITGLSIQGKNRTMKPIRLTSAPGILTRSDIKIDPSHLQTLEWMFEWPGHTAPKGNQQQVQLSDGEQQQFVLGRQHYLTTCAGCHGTDGAGLNRFAPTLIGSDWVLGDAKRLALIILHGLEGPVEVAGKIYDAPEILPVMPAHSTMDDKAITAIMTYIRNEWGNNAGPAERRIVGTTRHTSQGRVVPWTPKELNQHMLEETKAPPIQ